MIGRPSSSLGERDRRFSSSCTSHHGTSIIGFTGLSLWKYSLSLFLSSNPTYRGYPYKPYSPHTHTSLSPSFTSARYPWTYAMIDTYISVYVHVNHVRPGYRTRGLTSQRYIAGLASSSKVTLFAFRHSRGSRSRDRERERERECRDALIDYGILYTSILYTYIHTHIHTRKRGVWRRFVTRDYFLPLPKKNLNRLCPRWGHASLRTKYQRAICDIMHTRYSWKLSL